MSTKPTTPSTHQRNALAPSRLASTELLLAPALIEGEWFLLVRFIVSILAVIVGWFAIQARQWWWARVFLTIAVLFNQILPSLFEGSVWLVAQLVAAVLFLVAESMIKARRAA